MKYPTGVRRQRNTTHENKTNGLTRHTNNRGITLEKELNETNEYYLVTNKAVIHKKPTPIQIVNVHYPKRSAAVITEGYFKQPSTTDYNGIYKQRYIDFEAKETKNKTTFPLANIQSHQIEHMKSVLQHGGICFFIIRFTIHEKTYLLPSEILLIYWKESLIDGRKSIPYDDIREKGYLIPFKYQPRIDYLPIVDKLYF